MRALFSTWGRQSQISTQPILFSKILPRQTTYIPMGATRTSKIISKEMTMLIIVPQDEQTTGCIKWLHMFRQSLKY
jgi:hypothetical protein